MGDFYETFFEDAQTIAKELEITLTGRPETTYPGGRIPMAGVPTRAIRPYIAKLLERNYKVYIAEQMADPKTCKGLVPREITKVFTPGTINDLEFLDSYQNNFILAAYSSAPYSHYGLAYADISTGEFYLTEIKAEYLEQELSRINASEIILPSKPVSKQEGQIVQEEELMFNFSELNIELYLSGFNYKNFDTKLATENIENLFKLNSVKQLEDSFSPESSGYALRAAGAIIEYLKETQGAEFSNNSARNFDQIRTYHVSEYMMLDAGTRRNLELSKTLSGSNAGSFFSAIDRTSSKLGRRKLRAWMEQPLYDISAINARLDAVSELVSSPTLCNELKTLLAQTYDIDRLSNRLASELISPREAVALKDSMIIVTQLSSLMQNLQSGLLTSLKHIPEQALDYIRTVDNAVNDSPALGVMDGGILKRGYNADLDELISLVEDSEAWMKNFEDAEREKLGIKNLKVSFNKVHGYFIETSRLNEKRLPGHYVIKQTMVNTIRAVTEELMSFEEKVTNAESKRNALEYEIYSDLRKSLAIKSPIIKQLALQVAQLDALLSMALLAIEKNYNRPELSSSTELHIEDGRHPVLEQKLKLGEFVPNDIFLGAENIPAENHPSDPNAAIGDLRRGCKIMILTGPNMAGKSTYMRQNALIILLAQMGSSVPATKARIGLVDRIFTRIGASDDLASGRSTFMVEMNETATIINAMTARSFIVLDEIGRGTSTYDGVAIAWSIVEHIAKTTQARTIFATHYHELANLDRLYPCIKNYQVLVVENDSPNAKTKIEFLHKVAEGSADRSYGIEVARLAGLPKSVLDRAKAINNQLQAQRSRKLGMTKKQLDQHGITDAISDDGELDIEKLPLFSL
jgi:DNA mismatch repair protein MutS